MQGKGFIKVIALILLVMSLYLLFFTWQANKVEKNALADSVELVNNLHPESTGKDSIDLVRQYNQTHLDSIFDEPVFKLGPLKFNYKYIKRTALKLGLDLQGGMSVVVEADLENLVKSLSDDSQNTEFLAAIASAKAKQASTQDDFITLFAREFKGSNDDFIRIFRNINSESDIVEKHGQNPSKSNIVSYLQSKATDAFESSYDVILNRIDPTGTLQPSIQKQEAEKRILLDLPGVDNPKRIRELIVTSANLEFYEVYSNQDASPFLYEIDRIVKNSLDIEEDVADEPVTEPVTSPDSQTIPDTDPVVDPEGQDSGIEGILGNTEDSTLIDAIDPEKANPFLALIQPATYSAAFGSILKSDTAKVNKYLTMPEVQASLPSDMKIYWDALPFVTTTTDDNKKVKLFNLYALRGDGQGKALIDGSAIRNAVYQPDQQGDPGVTMAMNEQGANLWANLTENNVGKPIAIVLDNKVWSAPAPSEKIDGGNSSISGNFTVTEAKDLATVIKTGKLDVPAKIIEEAVVGPTLGKESIQSGLKALLLGLLLVLAFMVLYYGKAGIIADIALLFNLLLVMGILAALGATLTLPGIAGLVLTVGMAVDANVIIFERIREELGRGSGLEKAIRDGYQASYSAIIDANVTTFIIALILYFFGIGPIKGFATILMIGIATSMFTGVLLTRVFKDDILKAGKHISYWTGVSEKWFRNLNFDFINKRKIAYVVSGALILLSLGNIAVNGSKAFNWGVDMSGGRAYLVDFKKDVDANAVRTAVFEAFDEASVEAKTFGEQNQMKITSNYLLNDDGLDVDDRAELALYEGLKDIIGGDIDFDEFKAENLLSRQKVSASIADDLRRSALWLTGLALAFIFLYLFARFLKWQYGLAAIITLLHDTLILLGVFSLFRHFLPFSLEIDQAFIAALLTVIGYSINDTVVVFDRIREFLNLHPKKPHKEVINDAINSTLSRTLITSFTTLLVILLLFIFGGSVIRGFAFALLLGVMVGTYSSIFVATPIVADLYTKGKEKIKGKKPKKDMI